MRHELRGTSCRSDAVHGAGVRADSCLAFARMGALHTDLRGTSSRPDAVHGAGVRNVVLGRWLVPQTLSP